MPQDEIKAFGGDRADGLGFLLTLEGEGLRFH